MSYPAGPAFDRASARLAMEMAAYVCDVGFDDVNASGRGSAEAASARQLAMYLAHVAFEMSYARVAIAFGRDRSTVAHACRTIEDRRDDPAFDSHVDTLESMLRDAPPPGAVANRTSPLIRKGAA